MKKVLSVIIMVAVLLVAKFANAQEKAKWAEKDAFHKIMSQTFHPAEEGKLEPIRKRSQEMVDAASAWKNSAVPAGYENANISKDLKKLVKGAKKLHKNVQKSASDTDLKEELTELHDLFHKITEKCSGEDHH
jgi:hypothetical protein